jgi:hypothetical protein
MALTFPAPPPTRLTRLLSLVYTRTFFTSGAPGIGLLNRFTRTVLGRVLASHLIKVLSGMMFTAGSVITVLSLLSVGGAPAAGVGAAIATIGIALWFVSTKLSHELLLNDQYGTNLEPDSGLNESPIAKKNAIINSRFNHNLDDSIKLFFDGVCVLPAIFGILSTLIG